MLHFLALIWEGLYGLGSGLLEFGMGKRRASKALPMVDSVLQYNVDVPIEAVVRQH